MRDALSHTHTKMHTHYILGNLIRHLVTTNQNANRKKKEQKEDLVPQGTLNPLYYFNDEK